MSSFYAKTNDWCRLLIVSKYWNALKWSFYILCPPSYLTVICPLGELYFLLRRFGVCSNFVFLPYKLLSSFLFKKGYWLLSKIWSVFVVRMSEGLLISMNLMTLSIPNTAYTHRVLCWILYAYNNDPRNINRKRESEREFILDTILRRQSLQSNMLVHNEFLSHSQS